MVDPDSILTFERIAQFDLAKTSPITDKALHAALDLIQSMEPTHPNLAPHRFAAMMTAVLGSTLEGAIVQLMLRLVEVETRLAALDGAKSE